MNGVWVWERGRVDGVEEFREKGGEFGIEEKGDGTSMVVVGCVDEVFGVVNLRVNVESAVRVADAFQAEGRP